MPFRFAHKRPAEGPKARAPSPAPAAGVSARPAPGPQARVPARRALRPGAPARGTRVQGTERRPPGPLPASLSRAPGTGVGRRGALRAAPRAAPGPARRPRGHCLRSFAAGGLGGRRGLALPRSVPLSRRPAGPRAAGPHRTYLRWLLRNAVPARKATSERGWGRLRTL